MWQTRYEQYTKDWFEIKVNLRVKLCQVVEWCNSYDSHSGFFIDYNDEIFNCPLRMKFQSQEDMVMFMMQWLDI